LRSQEKVGNGAANPLSEIRRGRAAHRCRLFPEKVQRGSAESLARKRNGRRTPIIDHREGKKKVRPKKGQMAQGSIIQRSSRLAKGRKKERAGTGEPLSQRVWQGKKGECHDVPHLAYGRGRSERCPPKGKRGEVLLFSMKGKKGPGKMPARLILMLGRKTLAAIQREDNHIAPFLPSERREVGTDGGRVIPRKRSCTPALSLRRGGIRVREKKQAPEEG